MVIPAMDFIDSSFTDNIHTQDVHVSPAIRAALRLAKKTLNRYYTLTDASNVYRIAMGMFLSRSFTVDQPTNTEQLQFYIPATRWTIFKTLDGNQHGFQQRASSFATRSTNHMQYTALTQHPTSTTPARMERSVSNPRV